MNDESNQTGMFAEAEQSILIEGYPEPELYRVSGTSEENCECSCGKRSCFHLRVGRDILFNRGWNGVRWIAKSGLHKELRHGDMKQALLWAHWFERMWGKASVLSYLRRIWCEETVNLDLLEKIDSLFSIPEIIQLYCSSRKRWEFEGARKGFLMASRADTAAQAGRDGPILNETNELKRLMEASDLLPIMSALVAPESDNVYSEMKREIRSVLLKSALENGFLNEKQVQAFKRRYKSGRFEDEDTVLAMLHAGMFEPGMNEYLEIEPVEIEEIYLPFPRPYILDYHTAMGKRRLSRWKRETGKKLWFGVDTGKLDYRWAGGCVPLYWRFIAWKRFGAEMDTHRWNEVILTGEEEREIEGLVWAEE